MANAWGTAQGLREWNSLRFSCWVYCNLMMIWPAIARAKWVAVREQYCIIIFAPCGGWLIHTLSVNYRTSDSEATKPASWLLVWFSQLARFSARDLCRVTSSFIDGQCWATDASQCYGCTFWEILFDDYLVDVTIRTLEPTICLICFSQNNFYSF